MELTGAHRWLGPLHLKQLPTREFQTDEQLTCGLSDSQLRGIEALRDGRDLPLRLHLDAVLLHSVDELYPVIRAQEAGTVPAEAWARQLESLGAAVVVEVLVPLPLDGSELHRAVGRIREARGHITDGKYEEAVIKARAALGYVRTLVPHDDVAYKVKSRERTQAQRWSVLIDDLYSLASGANHDDPVTEHFTWSRDDAVMIVSAVAGPLGPQTPPAPARHAGLRHARRKPTTPSNQKQELPTTSQTSKAHGIDARPVRSPLPQGLVKVVGGV